MTVLFKGILSAQLSKEVSFTLSCIDGTPVGHIFQEPKIWQDAEPKTSGYVGHHAALWPESTCAVELLTHILSFLTLMH